MVKHCLFLSAILGVLGGGCDSSDGKQDTHQNTDSDNIPAGKGVLSGVVTDQSGVPVNGVTVAVGDVSVETDDNGRFTVEADPGDQVVRFSKNGYAESGLAVVVTDGAETLIQEGLIKRAAAVKTDIDSGETVGEAARVTLKSGVLVSADGTAATGEVSAYITPIDVTGNLTAAPGDFSAIQEGGEETRLETLGMAEYYFEDADGKPLNVADGEKVEIELALPVDIDAEAGDIIPAWHFDVETGKWIEDGEGEVIDDGNGGLVWRVEVSHFSFWNADKPIEERDCVSGAITDCRGNAVQGATVNARGISYRGESSGYPGESASYCVDVKRGGEVDILVVGKVDGNTVGKRVVVTGKDAGTSCEEGSSGCSKQDIELPCDPEESDLDCGDSPDLPCKACVSGRVVTADGDPIEDAIISFSNDDNGYGGRGMGESGGNFCIPAPLNVPLTLSINVAGYPPTAVTVTATQKGECPDCTDVGDIVLEKDDGNEGTILEKCNESEVTVDAVDLDGADEVFANLPYVGMLLYSAGEGESANGYLWLSNSDNPDEPIGSSSIMISFAIPAGAGAGESTTVSGFGNLNAEGIVGVNSEMYVIDTGTISWNETFEKTGQTLTGNWSFEMTTSCGLALRTLTFEGTFRTNVLDAWDLIDDTNQCLEEIGNYGANWNFDSMGIATLKVNGTSLNTSAYSTVVYYPTSGTLILSVSETDSYSFMLLHEDAIFGTQNTSMVTLDDSATSCSYSAEAVPELIIEENDASDLAVAPVKGSFAADLPLMAGECTDAATVSGTFTAAICAE